jgi:uracil-DNA glycosylase family 4
MPDSFLNPGQIGILHAMGIEVWRSRGAHEAARGDERPSEGEAYVEVPDDWDSLAAAVAGCERCSLYESRRQTVFGVGDRGADWMIIGEAPGADEDRQGEPFVGKAGQLLNEMLRAAGFARGDVYIANILKCRPPNNRDPRPDEVAACAGYLRRQVEMVAPKLILAVGRIAAQNLLHREEPVGRLRGEVHRLEPLGVPVVVTYHPAYLLRSPAQKRKAWADLCLARSVADRSPK